MLTYIPMKLSYATLLLAALFVQSVTCEGTANQAAKATEPTNKDPVSKSNEKITFIDQPQDTSIVPTYSDLHATNQVTDSGIANTPNQFSENSDDATNEIGANQLWEPYLAEEQYRIFPEEEDASIYGQGVNEAGMPSQKDLSEYILHHLSDAQKRFMRGLKRNGDGLEIDEDKRFMRGFNFKRDMDIGDESEDQFSNEQSEDKRFLRGLNQYAKKDDKRFMRGLRGDSGYQDLMDKRFMRGLRNWDSENIDDKRFIVGLNRFAGVPDKRFMRGFSAYNKRFIHGLQNYGKRFMRGLVKRDDSVATENEKRFIMGLNGYGRRADTVNVNKGIASDGANKRFIKGFPSGKRFIKGFPSGKRFMKGFGRFSKKYSPGGGDEYFNGDNELFTDKRFMRGLTKKDTRDFSEDEDATGMLQGSETQFKESNDNFDKRFIKGLGKKSDGMDPDKRFMRGLVKKPLGEDFDKRFIKGLVKKSDGEDVDKRFMRGLVKKPNSEDLDKRFMRGLVKKPDGEDTDKRFIKGLVKKSDGEDLDKRFMRGLVKKSDDTEDKRFIKGLVKKSEDTEDLDKRFIKGLVKKSDDMEDLDKRFIKGLVKKSDDTEDLDKRFIKGLVKKSDDTEDTDKRFIKGLVRKSEEDKRFMRGLNKKFDDTKDKRFIKGLVNRHNSNKKNEDDKRFMRGFGKKNSDEDQLRATLDKRFMRGLYAKKDSSDKTGNDEKFVAEHQTLDKRDNEFTNDDINDNNGNMFMPENYKLDGDNKLNNKSPGQKNVDLHEKRFIKGLQKYVKKEDGTNNGIGSEMADEKRFMRGLNKKDDDKRFMRGLVKKEESDNISEGDDKRFMRGLIKRESSQSREKRETRFRDENESDIFRKQDSAEEEDSLLDRDSTGSWYDFPVYQQPLPEKRFMRGLGQYTKRDFDDSSRDIDETETGYDDDYDISKRFLRGFLNNYNNMKEFLPKRLTGRDEYEPLPESDKRFIKGLDMYPRPVVGKRFMRGMQYLGRRAGDDTFLEDKRFIRGFNPFSRHVDKRFIRGLGKYVKRPLDSPLWGNSHSGDRMNKRLFTGHKYVVPDNNQQQLSGPSYRHSQLSFYKDQLNPIHVKEDSLTVPLSGELSQIGSRRFLDWRKGGYA